MIFWRRVGWVGPVLVIAALDLAVRWRQALQWTPTEFAWYAASVGFALLWLRASVWLLLPLRHSRSLFWLAALVQGAISAWILLAHFNHYTYFGVHLEVISFSQLLNETAETLRVIGAAFTPVNQLAFAGLTLALVATWRMGLDAPPRRRQGWVLLGIGVVLLPVFHNNVQWGRGNFYPAVNFTFAFSKAAEFHAQGRTFRHLPLAQRPAVPPSERPFPYDTLFFLSESVRAKSVSYRGYERDTTPQARAFFTAHPGQVFQFRRCYTNSIHTNPSVPSILSGVHPLRFPTRMGRTPLLYEYAAAAQTATFFYSAQAFETYRFQEFFESKLLGRFIYQENSGHPPFSFGGMDDEFLLPLLRQSLDEAVAPRRYSGILHFNGTHHPYRVPEDAVTWQGGTPMDLYDNAVRYQDTIVGAALQEISTRGRMGQTIAFFTSDHGEGMNEHGISGHRRGYYEEFIHVPCWLYLPELLAKQYGAGLRANEQAIISNVDWVPTLVELMGLANQPEVKALLEQLDGRSLLHPLPEDRLIVVHNGITNVRVLQGFALLRGSQRLLFHPVGDVGKIEVYDLAADPGQRKNLWLELPEAKRREWADLIENEPVLRDEVRKAPPPGWPAPR